MSLFYDQQRMYDQLRRQMQYEEDRMRQSRMAMIPMNTPSSTIDYGQTLESQMVATAPRTNVMPTESQSKMALGVLEDIKTTAQEVKTTDKKRLQSTTDRLKKLGFSALHEKTFAIAERAMKENMIGLAGYKRITKDKVKAASDKIHKESKGVLYLSVTSIEKYMGQSYGQHDKVDESQLAMPPETALDALEKARGQELFDSYSILHVARVPDPILVGQVKGSEDMFMIAEWGDDISFDKIVNE